MADLGVSSHQFDFGARGFSIRFDAPLDMRMDQTSELTAHRVVNSYSAEALTKLLYAYAELSNAPQWTEAIISRRKKAEINTTFELIDAVAHLTPESKKSKLLAQLFQGIRVEVNQELASLESFLLQLNNLIDTKGRLVVISYHSLEDRLVKRFIRSGHIDGQIRKDFYGNPEPLAPTHAPPRPRSVPPSPARTFVSIARAEGVMGMYRGLGPPVCMMMVMNSMNFGAFYHMRMKLAGANPVGWGTERPWIDWRVVCAAASVGPLCAMVSTPFELVKLQVQLDAANHSRTQLAATKTQLAGTN